MSVYREREDFLEKSINSILNQTLKNIEFVIIDDNGENNPSSRLLYNFYKNDRRIKLIKNSRNIGLTKSLNKGLRYCKAEFIARMDADDISKKDRLERQLNTLKMDKDLVLVGSWAELINSEGKVVGRLTHPTSYKKIRSKLLFSNPFIHPSIMFRKSLLAHVGVYDPSYNLAEDYELYTRIVKNHKVINLPITLIEYRIHGGRLTAKNFGLNSKFTSLRIKIHALMRGYHSPSDILNLLLSFLVLFLPSKISIVLASRFSRQNE